MVKCTTVFPVWAVVLLVPAAVIWAQQPSRQAQSNDCGLDIAISLSKADLRFVRGEVPLTGRIKNTCKTRFALKDAWGRVFFRLSPNLGIMEDPEYGAFDYLGWFDLLPRLKDAKPDALQRYFLQPAESVEFSVDLNGAHWHRASSSQLILDREQDLSIIPLRESPYYLTLKITPATEKEVLDPLARDDDSPTFKSNFIILKF